MQKVVAAFVGYAKDLEHPYSVATNHGNALRDLCQFRQECGFRPSGIPKYYGFVVKNDDGSYAYASRSEAYDIAKRAMQLKDAPSTWSDTGASLDSYQIKEYDREEVSALFKTAFELCQTFAGKKVENILP